MLKTLTIIIEMFKKESNIARGISGNNKVNSNKINGRI